MSHLPPAPLNPDEFRKLLPTRDQMREMSVDDLLKFLDLSGGLSDIILELAADAWRALTDLKVDLGEYLRQERFRRVRDIAEGRLAAQAVAAFGTRTRLLSYVRRLPVRDQREFAEGKPATIMEKQPDGSFTPRKYRFDELEREHLDQLITPDGDVRTDKQQIALLTRPTPPSCEPRVIISRGRLRTVGDVPVADVIRKLREKGFIPGDD